MNRTCFFFRFGHVAAGSCKVTQVARTKFLLDSAALGPSGAKSTLTHVALPSLPAHIGLVLFIVFFFKALDGLFIIFA